MAFPPGKRRSVADEEANETAVQHEVRVHPRMRLHYKQTDVSTGSGGSEGMMSILKSSVPARTTRSVPIRQTLAGRRRRTIFASDAHELRHATWMVLEEGSNVVDLAPVRLPTIFLGLVPRELRRRDPPKLLNATLESHSCDQHAHTPLNARRLAKRTRRSAPLRWSRPQSSWL